MVIKVVLPPVSHLGEIGALGRPHGSSTKTKDEGGWKECVELGVELGRDVGGVAEHTHHQGPLHRQLVDHDRGQEHAGQDQGGVHHRVRPDTQASDDVDGRLQLGHGLEGNEEEQEGEGDDENISINPPLLRACLLWADVWGCRSGLCRNESIFCEKY